MVGKAIEVPGLAKLVLKPWIKLGNLMLKGLIRYKIYKCIKTILVIGDDWLEYLIIFPHILAKYFLIIFYYTLAITFIDVILIRAI